ncbi:MAG: peptide ABC transporter substrate-binding protein [Ardenticatenaceae bacterium]|nr:peptide ABC transporter substrate-binding protein [Ardenticatenaceae bacterium]
MIPRKWWRATISLSLIVILLGLAAGCGPAATPPPPAPTTAPAAAQAPTAAPTAPPAAEPTTAPPTQAPTTVPTAPPAAEQVLLVPLSRLGGSIDPGLSYGQGYEFLLNLFDGLTRVDYATGELVPAVAEKWDISADGTVYTFHLRSELEWSDGTPVTAGDFEYSWKRTLDPKTEAPIASDLYHIKGAEAYNKGENTDPESVGVKVLDDLTLQVTLEAARPGFPADVAGVVYYPLPRWAIEKYGTEGDAWMKPGNIVVNGPYTIATLEPDQEVVLVRNENYKGEPKPAIDKATWVLFESYISQSLLAFEAGELDIAWVPGTDLERVRNDPSLSKMMQEYAVAATAHLTFDTTNPPFDDARVRRALSLAVDREVLNNVILKGQYAPAYTSVPPQLPGYSAEAAAILKEGGPEEAKTLLAEAGYPGGEGLREIEYVGPSSDEYRLIAEALQGMWQDTLGVTVNLNLMESKALSAWAQSHKQNKESYDIRGVRRMTMLSTDPAGWYNGIYDPDIDWLDIRWQDDRFTELIRQGRYEQDPVKRAKMYQEAEMIFMEASPVIPFYHTVARWVVQPYVKGLAFPVESAGQIIDLRPISVESH